MAILQKEIKLLIVNLVFKKGKHAEAIQIKCQEMGLSYHRLPTYSPELNPIELVWAHLKQELAKKPISDDLYLSVLAILEKVNRSPSLILSPLNLHDGNF